MFVPLVYACVLASRRARGYAFFFARARSCARARALVLARDIVIARARARASARNCAYSVFYSIIKLF